MTSQSNPLFSSASFDAVDFDEGITVQVRDGDEQREIEDNPVTKNNTQQTDSSVFGEISTIRNFFIAAFSDGYYNTACCGAGDYLIPTSNCSPNDCYSAKLPSGGVTGTTTPMDTTTAPQTIRGPNSTTQIGRTTSSLSQNSNTVHSGGSENGRKKRRNKRPLAVAVGFKYVEDMNGRPVVITPGRRLLAVRPGRSQSSSPASQPTATVNMKLPLPHLLLPLDRHDDDQHTTMSSTTTPHFQPRATEEKRLSW